MAGEDEDFKGHQSQPDEDGGDLPPLCVARQQRHADEDRQRNHRRRLGRAMARRSGAM